jgi:hypothetical protein
MIAEGKSEADRRDRMLGPTSLSTPLQTSYSRLSPEARSRISGPLAGPRIEIVVCDTADGMKATAISIATYGLTFERVGHVRLFHGIRKDIT